MKPEPLVILAGPTAVGKTSAAIGLCQWAGAEVVSADSVQVYRGLDIGSAKPTPAELAAARHHLVDVAEPTEQFTAARFVELADAAIEDIRSRGKRVLVAGGTGLYVKALLHGLAAAPAGDPGLRGELEEQWQAQGGPAMHERLIGLDPVAAERINPADRQRVLRALEVCLMTGKPFSLRLENHGFKETRYEHVVIGLDRPREELYQRIQRRCFQMWEGGLLEEVRGLLGAGVPAEAKPLNSLGYRHALMTLLDGRDPMEALGLMIKDTKAYAKRQLTWFRAVSGINWHHPDDLEGIRARAARAWDHQAVQ